MDCTEERDICITRGDTYFLIIGLARNWEEVNASPALYEGRLVIREAQDDSLTPLLEVTADLEAGEDSRFPDMEYMVDLSLTPAQTQSLPTYNVVCFAEIRKKDLSYVKRLFNGRVTRSD